MNKEALIPDTDDWTWVLRQPCPQCGADVRTISTSRVLEAAPRYVARFRARLEEDPGAGRRPEALKWSPLEYGAHLRDVSEVFRSRVRSMLLHEEPSYEDWDQNRAAADGAYLDLEPARVADELKTAAGDLLRDAAALSEEEFTRTGHRSDGFTFTVESLLQYYLHELVHHWWDVSGQRFSPEE